VPVIPGFSVLFLEETTYNSAANTETGKYLVELPRMERPRATRSAKWGEACAPCAVAKTRCIRSRKFPGAKCDKCQSLEKNCSDQVHGPRKKRQAKSSYVYTFLRYCSHLLLYPVS